jgi:hypothetical protein
LELLLALLSGLIALVALGAGLACLYGALVRRREKSAWTGRLLQGMGLVLIGGFAVSFFLTLVLGTAEP